MLQLIRNLVCVEYTGSYTMNRSVIFEDYYQNKVTFSCDLNPFSAHPKHVWVICQFHDQWLLTRHPRRGWEFPGGKVEKGETAEEAAIREVYEETGAHVSSIHYIGQYKVEGKSGTIIKNVYFAKIDEVKLKDDYMETQGPIFLNELPKNIKDNHRFSFMMKDEVLEESLKHIRHHLVKNRKSQA